MNLELILMSENDIAEFKKNVQCAFQKGFEDVFEKVLESLFGMRLKSYILIQRYGKLVLHILKNATSTFM